MNVRSDMAMAARALDDLARIARILPEVFGATLDVRRVIDDVHRLQASLGLLNEAVIPQGLRFAHELEVIPDHEYHPSFWLDADHEGIGGMAGLGRSE
ncbi:MAG: hypothetical protein QOH56_4405 [Pseudonocardiales bacterium]|jgi:hypothetical protein|nr:hypothetical protein [Pseudonocardiales bacterium]